MDRGIDYRKELTTLSSSNCYCLANSPPSKAEVYGGFTSIHHIHHTMEFHYLAPVDFVSGDKAVTGAKEEGEDKQMSGRAEGPHGRRLRGRQLK